MHAQPRKRSHQERAIEFLAQESQVPLDEVTRLYKDEWAGLEDGARITGFLAIFTTRNVRETLRRRSESARLGRKAAPPASADERMSSIALTTDKDGTSWNFSGSL